MLKGIGRSEVSNMLIIPRFMPIFRRLTDLMRLTERKPSKLGFITVNILVVSVYSDQWPPTVIAGDPFKQRGVYLQALVTDCMCLPVFLFLCEYYLEV